MKLNSDRRRRAKYSCVVADLGLAEKIPTTPEDEARLTMVGTPYIMAPEVLLGKPYNEKVSVFCHGLCLKLAISNLTCYMQNIIRLCAGSLKVLNHRFESRIKRVLL